MKKVKVEKILLLTSASMLAMISVSQRTGFYHDSDRQNRIAMMLAKDKGLKADEIIKHINK